jgi:hypothetical protein
MGSGLHRAGGGELHAQSLDDFCHVALESPPLIVGDAWGWRSDKAAYYHGD